MLLMMLILLNAAEEMQWSRVNAFNSLMTRGTSLTLSQLRSSELRGSF